MNQTEIKEPLKQPLVSIILPVYNEEVIIEKNTAIICDYLATLKDKYDWEILLINDGSEDRTGQLADSLAKSKNDIVVHHHKSNRNLGAALRTGFSKSHGDYVVVMDIDLSYAPEHIGKLLAEIQETEADIVIASPYMKGGKSTSVPLLRLILSKTVNYLMRKASNLHIYTFTGMVRAYKGALVRSLNTKSSTYDINPEIILKAHILRARVVEIPAHLDWSMQKQLGKSRVSSIRLFMGILNGLMSSFIFRPYAFFMISGLVVLIISTYVISWIFINTYLVYPETAMISTGFEERLTESVSEVFRQRPYSFFVGGTTLIIAIQLLGLGFLSLQKKRYFDELFHLSSAILNKQQ